MTKYFVKAMRLSPRVLEPSAGDLDLVVGALWPDGVPD
jgi:hypothetical protein